MAGQKNEALTSLTQHLQHIAFRKSFAANPLGALAAVGIDHTTIPAPVLDAFAGLSLDELTTLASVQKQVAPIAANGTGCNFF